MRDKSNNREMNSITFVVQKPDGTHSKPRWRETEVRNASCPRCGRIMAVIVGDDMYSYCPRCQRYYLADYAEENDERSHSQKIQE
jgi:endogenous inhibitor of DNA gyrase (YacG/DUF329 family)